MKRKAESEGSSSPKATGDSDKVVSTKRARDDNTEHIEDTNDSNEANDDGDVKRVRRRHRMRQAYSQIVKQMEFYFGDANLSKSQFMRGKLEENEQGWIDLKVFLTFNKIAQLLTENFDQTCTVKDLAKALRKAHSDMLEMEEMQNGEYRIRRTTKAHIKSESEVDACTIYVEHLPRYADIAMLTKLFENAAGPVDYVSLPRFKHTQQIKGFAFVEFREEDSVQKALDAFGLVEHGEPGDLASVKAFNAEAEGKESVEESKDKRAKSDEDKDDKKSKDDKKDKAVKDVEEKSEMVAGKSNEKKEMNDNAEDDEDEDSNNGEEKDGDEMEDVGDQSRKNDKNVGDSVKEINNTSNKKRRRRRRSCAPSSSATLLMSLQIMRKKDWKRLRNQYLNTQRQNVAQCKKRMQQWSRRSEPQTTNITTTTTVEPGTIIKFALSSPVQDKHRVRRMVQSAYVEPVAYVDVEEGVSEYYVRCNSKEQAFKLAGVSQLGKGTVLQGEEETSYFDKMATQRERHKKERVKRKEPRGRDKLKSRLQKNSHKYFDLDDDN